MGWEWNEVSGRGTIYSYQIVAHSVMPGFREWVPYPIVLVELDEQRGEPGSGDGLRITANLVNEDMLPEDEQTGRHRQARPRRFSRFRRRLHPPAIHPDGRTAGGRTLAVSRYSEQKTGIDLSGGRKWTYS